jgi:hypothetical protein
VKKRKDHLRWPPRRARRREGVRSTLAPDAVSAPRQPNERDESPDSQAGEPRAVITQAYRDLQRGLEDTDCRNRAGEVLRKSNNRAGRKSR